MALNEKNQYIDDAYELAALAGESRADRLLAIGKDCAAYMKEPYLSIARGDMLYGEWCLPR